jgi:glycosyltransferase involved in cell wall biosynthesis
MSVSQYKVLVNISTLIQGGGLQVAAAFIIHATNDADTSNWQYLISEGVAREITRFGIATSGENFHVFKQSPARHSGARERLRNIEAAMGPDLVFTLFGPAYVEFKTRHLCGVADPWVTHSNWIAFRKLGLSGDTIRKVGLMLWKAYWWKKVDYWWTEAPIARDGLVMRLHCDPDRIFVVPNTTGTQFDAYEYDPQFVRSGPLEILCLSVYYSHKNLELLPDVALEIIKLRPDLNFRFTVTLPQGWPEVQAIMERAEALGVSDKIRNLDTIPVTDTPDLYRKSHLTFLPSLLEVFSAVYPESLRTGVPLVTTDLRFARDVCGDAAAYFTPANARSAARQIVRLAENEADWRQISERGREVFTGLPNAAQKWALQKGMILGVAGLSD